MVAHVARTRRAPPACSRSSAGIITKHGTSVWSTTPPEAGFTFADISADVAAATPALDLVGDHRGAAVVDAYTVAHEAGRTSATRRWSARTADDTRVVVRNDDADVAADMAVEEWCRPRGRGRRRSVPDPGRR